jgi:hypothetical protein
MAASRGDGLRPELLQLFERLAKGADANFSETVDAYKASTLLTNFASKEGAAPDREALKKS